jgi:hypothetical protein
MITKSQAIRSLDPDSMFSIHEDVIKWDTPEISDAKINAEMARLQTEYNNNEYQRQRALAYAPLSEQLDMQYWDAINNTETWLDHIRSVKEAHPKEGE